MPRPVLICLALVAGLALLALPAEARKTRRRRARDEWRAEAAALADAPAQAAVPPTVIAHGRRDQRLVALTFDACSTRRTLEYDDRITKTLQETGTPATIFLGGHWALAQEEAVRALAAMPNVELGNHGYSHLHMRRLAPEAMREELRATQAAIHRLTGRQPELFRAPYVEIDVRVVAAAAELGLATVQFDVASGDPDRHAPPRKLADWVVSRVRPGSIVVMHINHRDFRTADALPEIIRRLRDRRYGLVTVGELIRRARADGSLLVDAPGPTRPRPERRAAARP